MSMYLEVQLSPSQSPDIDLDLDLDLDLDVDTERPQAPADTSITGPGPAAVSTNTRATSDWASRKRARYYTSDSDQEIDSEGYVNHAGTSAGAPVVADANVQSEDQDGSSSSSVSSGACGSGTGTGRRLSRSVTVAGKGKSVATGELITKTTTLNGTMGKPRRDDEYYMDDGSCVLLVEDTLFNVHRTILSKDTSSFSTMFTLPQGDHHKEGACDENPIVLTGDTVAEFKNFLWSLYALPHELKIVHAPMAPLTQLIDIARISNKYSFKSIETWSLDAIQVYVNRKPSPILTAIPTGTVHTFSQANSAISNLAVGVGGTLAIPAHPSTMALLTRLIRLAQMCSHEPLLGTMITLLRQLMSQSIQYAYLAMVLADELNLRSLRGAAYPEVMQKAVVVKRDEEGEGVEGEREGDIDKNGRLVVSRAQQLRLLSGYYRLTSTWEHLRSSPPPFDHAPSCGATWHQHGCTQSWLEFWKEKTRCDSVLALGLADVVGRLRAVGKEFEKWGSATYMHHDCRMTARRCIQEKIRAVEEELPGFFEEGV